MAKRERFVVIDGHALIHRAYHAIPPLTTKNGELVNAVYGFTMILLNVIRDLKPDCIAVAFDLPGKTVRHELYPEYKATRKEKAEDFYPQIELVREVVEAFNIPIYEMPGYEADDVIGTIVKKTPTNVENFVVTGDMDELQLVDERTKVYTMRRGFTDTVIYDEAAVFEKYNLTPEQFVDFKALKGDPSDNIPGVAGVGEKTACDLISKYGSLEEIYNKLDEIKPALAEKLMTSKDIAFLSQRLSQIELNLPLEANLKDCYVHDFDRAKVYALFQELGFKSLLAKLPEQAQKVSLFSPEEPREKSRDHIKSAKYVLVDSKETLETLVGSLKKQSAFAFDTETDSLNEVEANLVGMSFAFKTGESYYVPVGHREGKQIDKDTVVKTLKPILEDPKIGKVGHNIKFDWVIMKNAGINVSPIIFDTMIAAYLVNPNARAQRLDELAFSELGLDMIKIHEVIGKGKEEICFADAAISECKDYACEDADITWRLYNHLLKDLNEADLAELNEKIEAPLIPILGEMEMNGVKIDSAALAKTSKQMAKKIDELEKEIWKIAGEEFNIASPAQIQTVLFETLNLQEQVDPRELKKLKSGGYSTAAAELEKLRGLHPIIDHIFEYRELSKLKNTYVDTLPKLVSKKTGRIHTSFNQAITQTGRLSSSDPNLQNIPIRTEEGKKIREVFIADPGCVILSADYSQIELRVVAHIAGVKKMIEFFNQGRDIHGETAAAVYGVPQKEVTHSMRRISKIINFGILYGVSAHGLKQQTGVTREEGQDLINKYFELYPEIKEYSQKMIAQAKELGYVETIFGRRRFLPEIKSANFAVRGSAERMAINMPIQGTAADLIKLAMIDIANELPKVSPASKMLLQVHDELVFEVPEKEAASLAEFVKERMDKVVELSVPIETSVSWGKNWGATKE